MRTLAVLSLSLAAIGAAAFPVAADASGTIGGGQNALKLGQKVYAKKIACADCPYPDGLDASNLAEAVSRIESGAIELRGKERKAVLMFIERRFEDA